MSDNLNLPCDRCARSFPADEIASHVCVTPRDRATIAVGNAVNRASLVRKLLASTDATLQHEAWMRVQRLADEASDAFRRAAVAINEAAKVQP
jgi:hypothetical protein